MYFKGIKSSGKVTYFSAPAPYVLLFILLLRGIFLDGAWDGIAYLFKVDWAKLFDLTIWVRAAGQVFFQIAVGVGTLILFASYKDRHQPLFRSALIIPGITAATGFLCGITVFVYMGHMAHVANVEINQLPLAGPDLVFVAYPAALTLLPFSHFWAVLFFIMLFLLGMDTEFAFIEVVASHFEDERFLIKGKELKPEFLRLFITFAIFLLGFVLYTRGGFYFMPIYDTYSVNLPVIVVVGLECLVVAWYFGWDKLTVLIRKYTNEEVPTYVQVMTKFAAIPILGILALVAFLDQFWALFDMPWWFAIIALILMMVPFHILVDNYYKYKDEKKEEEKPLLELVDM